MARRAADGAHGSAAHRIRIIGGKWKRTPIDVPDSPDLRPTPDRVRETLFNWLGQRLDGLRCLDPFAGTGALGLEAASRGAAHVVLVERRRDAVESIARTIERLGASGVQVIAADAFVAMQRLAQAGERFDVVFLDPPFDDDLVDRSLAAVLPLLAPGARVYVETGGAFEAPAGWSTLRSDRAGQVRYHLLQRDDEARGAMR